jgi:hypothetical protein
MTDWPFGDLPRGHYDPDLDARDSYDLAVRTIGEKVRAGEPVPSFFQSTK